MDLSFDLFVLTLTGVLEHDLSTLVDNILRWPILVVVGVPRSVFIVLRYRISDAVPLEGGLSFPVDLSKGNSGVWMPMTTRPLSL